MKTEKKPWKGENNKHHEVVIEIQEKGANRKHINLKTPQDLKQIGKLLIKEIFASPKRASKKGRSGFHSNNTGSEPPIMRSKSMNQLITHLSKLKPTNANKLLESHLWELLPADLLSRYRRLRDQETFHIAHVRNCMDQLLPDKKPNQHDYSKNELYFFMTICHFHMGDICSVPKKYLDDVISNHHKAEPHHPEHEKHGKKKSITKGDIMEMAVDRLSRNLQGNQGQYDRQRIEYYYPSFCYDHKKRLELYKQYIDNFQPLVQREWKSLAENPQSPETLLPPK